MAQKTNIPSSIEKPTSTQPSTAEGIDQFELDRATDIGRVLLERLDETAADELLHGNSETDVTGDEFSSDHD